MQALSAFPAKPNTFSEEAALAVSSSSEIILDQLVDYGLVEVSKYARYTLHQTIADYAKFNCTNPAGEKRMVEYFVHYVEQHKMDYEALKLEVNNVQAALQIASGQRMYEHLVRGANAFYPFLEAKGLYELAEFHLTRAQQAAESFGDTLGLATILLNLGRIALKRGDHIQAEKRLLKGLALAREIEHLETISALLMTLGTMALNSGNYDQAEAYYQEGLILARRVANHDWISALLQGLGVVAVNRGNYDQAKVYYQEGLTLARQVGNRERISVLLQNLTSWQATMGIMTRRKCTY